MQIPDELHDELCRAITETRGGKHACRLATFLLDKDKDSGGFLGIDCDGRPIFYERAVHTITSYKPDEKGRIDNRYHQRTVLQHYLRLFGATKRWLIDHQEIFHWIHPRYRHLLEYDLLKLDWVAIDERVQENNKTWLRK